MKAADVDEAQQLVSTHNSLRWNLARHGHRAVRLYAVDSDQQTSHPYLPAPLGRQLLLIALALVEGRLRELGIEPEQGLEHDCFQCAGTGKQPMD